jgi:hypothetical protein
VKTIIGRVFDNVVVQHEPYVATGCDVVAKPGIDADVVRDVVVLDQGRQRRVGIECDVVANSNLQVKRSGTRLHAA